VGVKTLAPMREEVAAAVEKVEERGGWKRGRD